MDTTQNKRSERPKRSFSLAAIITVALFVVATALSQRSREPPELGASEVQTGSQSGASGSPEAVRSPSHVVRVLNDRTRAPMSGVPVVVNDARGEVLSQAQTAADGTLQIHVPRGGAVSVFMGAAIE